MVKVLVTEENPVLRLGVVSLLRDISEIELVGENLHSRPTAEMLRRCAPDVIVLGASPPAIDRIRALARNSFGARLAVLTATTDPGVLLQVLRAGAHSCVVHGHFQPQSLPQAVLATARGESVLSPPVMTALVAWLHRGDEATDQWQPGPSLTTREIEIMELISAGLNNRRIAERLFISEKTVKNHAYSIYKRLGAAGREHAIERWRRMNSSEAAAEEAVASE
ncbi:MAG TPA: response regulator transcription factor [Streptosporangiaceae bacterium]